MVWATRDKPAPAAGVENVAPGQRVALISCLSCLRCDTCQSGKTNCCENISVICCVHQDGGFCEFLAVPTRNLLRVYEVAPDAVALIEPFAINAHVVHRANVSADEHVLVVDAGPIGLGVAAIAAAAGAKVAVADTSEFRRAHLRRIDAQRHALSGQAAKGIVARRQRAQLTHRLPARDALGEGAQRTFRQLKRLGLAEPGDRQRVVQRHAFKALFLAGCRRDRAARWRSAPVAQTGAPLRR
ncbi:putative L-galactonate oxidoreductase|nr:putative L-galactonate oxidoreductase [Candidatus Pantoea persica]